MAQHIFVVGESPLVEEYCSLCVANNIRVTGRFNPGEKGRLPKGVTSAVTAPASATVALELTNLIPDVKKRNLGSLDRVLSPVIPILSSCVTVTVAEQSGWIRKPQRLIGIGALPSLLKNELVELARSEATDDRTAERSKELITMLGKQFSFVHDSIGLVIPRILCMLANEAYFAMMEGVAGGEDIDTAMTLGTNYPVGPVGRAREIGIKHVHAVLSALNNHFGEERYRIAPLLNRCVMTGR